MVSGEPGGLGLPPPKFGGQQATPSLHEDALVEAIHELRELSNEEREVIFEDMLRREEQAFQEEQARQQQALQKKRARQGHGAQAASSGGGSKTWMVYGGLLLLAIFMGMMGMIGFVIFL